YHCVEEIIEPMMPFSPFTKEEFILKTQDMKGNLYTSNMRLFEPNLSSRRRMSILVPELQSLGLWKQGYLGKLEVILVRASDVLAACLSLARKRQFCYLPE